MVPPNLDDFLMVSQGFQDVSRMFQALDQDFDPSTPGLTPSDARVPGSFDAAPPGVLGRRGVAMYRRNFQQKGRARLQFMGCSFYCRQDQV